MDEKKETVQLDVESDADQLLSHSLRKNVDFYQDQKDEEQLERVRWFVKNMYHIVEERFNEIDFMTKSKNGVKEYCMYDGDDYGGCITCAYGLCCCCCQCNECFGNVIERHIGWMFRCFLKQDDWYARKIHNLNSLEIANGMKHILIAIIKESKYDLMVEIRKGRCRYSTYIKW